MQPCTSSRARVRINMQCFFKASWVRWHKLSRPRAHRFDTAKLGKHAGQTVPMSHTSANLVARLRLTWLIASSWKKTQPAEVNCRSIQAGMTTQGKRCRASNSHSTVLRERTWVLNWSSLSLLWKDCIWSYEWWRWRWHDLWSLLPPAAGWALASALATARAGARARAAASRYSTDAALSECTSDHLFCSINQIITVCDLNDVNNDFISVISSTGLLAATVGASCFFVCADEKVILQVIHHIICTIKRGAAGTLYIYKHITTAASTSWLMRWVGPWWRVTMWRRATRRSSVRGESAFLHQEYNSEILMIMYCIIE